MSWLALALISAAFLGVYDIAKKASVSDNAVLPVLATSSSCAVAALLPMGILSMLNPALAREWHLLVPPLTASSHALILAKATIVTTSWVLGFLALKELPLSLAAPVRASSPLFTLVGAMVVFAERPTLQQLLGAAIILGAYWAFSWIGRLEGIHFARSRPVALLFGGLLVGAASGLYDKLLLAHAQLSPNAVQFWFTVDNAAIQAALAAVWWWPRRAATPFRFRWAIPAVGLLLLAADAAYFRALAVPGALVGIVSVVRRTNVLISFTVGGLLFRERNKRRKALALAFVLLGLLLLVRPA